MYPTLSLHISTKLLTTPTHTHTRMVCSWYQPEYEAEVIPAEVYEPGPVESPLSSPPSISPRFLTRSPSPVSSFDYDNYGDIRKSPSSSSIVFVDFSIPESMNRSASTAPSQTSSFHEVVWASEASPRQGRNTDDENDKIHHFSTPPAIPSSSDLHGKLAHLVSHRLSPSSNEVNGSSEATPGRQRKNDKIHHFSTPPPIPSSSKLHGKMPLCLMSGFISTPNVNPNPPFSLYCPHSSSTASSSKDFLIALQKVSPRQHENDNTDHFSTPPTPPPTPTIFRSSELHGKQTHRVGHRLSPSTLTASSSNAVNGSSEATPGRQHLKKTFRSSELHGKQTPQGWDAINTYYNCTGWCSRTMIHVINNATGALVECDPGVYRPWGPMTRDAMCVSLRWSDVLHNAKETSASELHWGVNDGVESTSPPMRSSMYILDDVCIFWTMCKRVTHFVIKIAHSFYLNSHTLV